MITASLVLYKSKVSEVERVLGCVENSIIDKVYVIDNSPTDDLRKVVKQAGPKKASYAQGHGNIGYGEGNNIGIRQALDAGSEYHAILNPDIIFEPEVIEHLRDYMAAHEEAGFIKPALTNVDGSFEGSAMLLPTPLVTFGRRMFPNWLVEKVNRRFELKDVDLTVTRNVPNFSGSFMFIRSSVFHIVGLFDDRYFMYFEDFDLVRRIHKVSQTVYYPHDTIIHAHAAEHRRNKKLLMLSIRAGIKYYNKWGWFFDSDRKKWNKEALSPKSILE